MIDDLGALPSVWNRAIEGLAELTRGVRLPEISGVHTRLQFDELIAEPPFIVWTPEGEMEENAESETWETVDVWYPGRFYLSHHVDPRNEPMRAILLGYRQAVLDELRRHATLPGVPECYHLKIKYGVAINPKLPQYANVVSAFTVQALCRTIKPAEVNVVSQGPPS